VIGNISRFPRSAHNGYRQVLLQQGRVLLDADFNEQGTLAAQALRQLTQDLIGRHAGPAHDLGFAIGKTANRFTISRGRYYVGGLLAANDPPDSDPNAGPLPYGDQEGVDELEFEATKPYFFYLDVWERSVSWLEDDTIREVALGGPDTTLRRQVVWQVRAIERPLAEADFDDEPKASKWLSKNVERHPDYWPDAVPRLPMMRAWVDPEDDPDETPCVADPLGGYRGLENQLYRVQIHDVGGPGGVTFKWSRENGSVMAGWAGHVANTLVVEGVRDTASGFAAGQWVEITDRVGELRGEPGVMLRLTKVERDHLNYDPASASGPLPTIENLVSPIVRRWDHTERRDQALSGGAIVLAEDRDYYLERGIKIRFPSLDPMITGERRYAVGDWWGFAARVATADIDWPSTIQLVGGEPQKVYLDRPPDGPEHVYAPLGVGTLNGPAVDSMQRKINQLWTAV
jgi:Family of unknown function (DUF6519)